MSETTTAPAAPDLRDPRLYFNRELSWLAFNARVLDLAEDPEVPLLERLKFCAIYSSNLDEFVMVRVAGLHDQVDAGVETPLQDGRSPAETLDAIRACMREQVTRQGRILGDLLRGLADQGVRVIDYDDVTEEQRATLRDRFRRQIFPVLTPLAVGPGRPFPYMSNLSLSIGVTVRDPESGVQTFARVKVPTEVLPRFVSVDGGCTFIALEHLIQAHLGELFPGMDIVSSSLFRVTRDADFTVSDEADDLLAAVEAELRRRRFGEVVRLEVLSGMPDDMLNLIVRALPCEPEDVVSVDGLLSLVDLWELVKISGRPELRDAPWSPAAHPRLTDEAGAPADVMAAMRQGDILLHHPYHSFTASVVRLMEQAVADDDVLAIKMTVYRTSDDTPLIPGLIRAAERGKQAVCMVELKARFDESQNIQWARALEESGVHVSYGSPSLKTHAKCLLVVRREGDGIRNYVHVGTGNYNPSTARLYTDFGLLTCDDALASDVSEMFNRLTGFSHAPVARKALLAPDHLREGILEEIARTIAAAEEGRPARIRMKMNALVDRRCIRALFRASRAGVQVELNIRGICCLRPGVEDISENVRVVSVVGRFLEHSRIFAFIRGDEERVFIGSADLMPRNLDTRVELVTPVEDPAAKEELIDTLDRAFADDTNAWELGSDGEWRRLTPAEEPGRNLQRELMALHSRRAVSHEDDE